mgnify:CR=1 FL=1
MTETAKMYGGSLYDLAAEEGLETRILGELDEVQQLLKQNPDYLRLLSTPSIPKKERCGLLDEALRGQVHLYVLNFLKILCEKGTLRELSGCARAYRIRYNQAHGILEATAISAVPLTEQQRTALHAKLESLTGKTIDLKTKVDAKVLGGIRLDIEGTELDGTVRCSVLSPRLLPTVTHYDAGKSNVRTYLFRDYTEALTKAHGVRQAYPDFSLEMIQSIARKNIDPEFLQLT